jgi:tetratricopeptide (TPR) repeat protein
MSYYGNSWNAVAYYRSSSNWNMGNHEQPWEKEHYGVYEARAAYQKAYELATEKEFKAACLFMVAKCAQRQVVMPPYDYKNYEQYEKAMEAFNQKFKNNPLFAKFKTEFGTTKFYQYAYNRCSYLRDYIKKGTAPTKPVTKPKGKG